MAENSVVWTYAVPTGPKISVVEGDLTLEAVDAIVNAANEHLSHGGGVAWAIARRGGKVIQEESTAWVREHGPVPTGQAALTGGGHLAARYVIHTVGPIWRDQGDEPALLRSAIQSALALADAHALHSVSLPAISSGIFGVPKPLAAQVIWDATLDYLAAHPESTLEEIRFCDIDRATVEIFLAEGRKRQLK